MQNKNALAIFDGYKIRRHYDEKTEIWFFSVIDIVAALTDQADFKKAKSYWTTLKNRLKNDGSEVVTKCDHLKKFPRCKDVSRFHVGGTQLVFFVIKMA